MLTGARLRVSAEQKQNFSNKYAKVRSIQAAILLFISGSLNISGLTEVNMDSKLLCALESAAASVPNITFAHVPAHSLDKRNQAADRFAREILGIDEQGKRVKTSEEDSKLKFKELKKRIDMKILDSKDIKFKKFYSKWLDL